jgi:hypothetical protein
MNKFKQSWLLVKSSLSVVTLHKELMVFPITIFLCTVSIVLFFLAPPVLRPTGHSYLSSEHWEAISHSLFQQTGHLPDNSSKVVFTPGATAYVAFLYLLAMFIGTFCNVAFYHEILAALRGETVSIWRGLRFAGTKAGSILMWTLFAGLVGWLIKAMEKRLGIIGQIIAKFIGLAWSLAAVFAIPVIVTEEQNANPLAVLSRSADILKRTWGEALIGYVGLTFANGLILIGSLFWLGGIVALSIALKNFWILGVASVAWLLSLCIWSYIIGVASHVYRGALFLYASEGVVPQPYSREMIDLAWKYKGD